MIKGHSSGKTKKYIKTKIIIDENASFISNDNDMNF